MLDTIASSITYNGNDATTSFDYPFKIFSATEIEVWLTDAAGAETQINSDNFTVSGAGDDAGGSVLYPVAGNPVATGEKLTLRRILAVKQDFFDPSNNTAFQAEVLEDSADKTVALVQQIKTDVDRSLRGSLASDIDTELPKAEAGKVLAWNVAEDALINLGVSSVLPEGTINTVDINDDAITPAKVAAAVAGTGLTQAGDGSLAILFRGANALVFLDASQVLADDVPAAIVWTDEVTDTNDFSDISAAGPNPGRLTVPAGVSRVKLTGQIGINWTNTPTTSWSLEALIRKNGAGTYPGKPIHRIGTDAGSYYENMSFQVSTPVLAVSPGDYFELVVRWQDAGGSITLDAFGTDNGDGCWFAIEVIE